MSAENSFHMSDTDFAESLGVAVQWVKHCIETNASETFMPSMLLYLYGPIDDLTIGHHLTVLMLAGFDTEKRYEILEAIGAKVARDEQLPSAMFFMSEVWLSLPGSDGKRKYKSFADDPDRREAITVAGMTYDGRMSSGQVAILRGLKNVIVAGETKLYPYGGEVETKGDLPKAFYRGFARAMMAELMSNARNN